MLIALLGCSSNGILDCRNVWLHPLGDFVASLLYLTINTAMLTEDNNSQSSKESELDRAIGMPDVLCRYLHGMKQLCGNGDLWKNVMVKKGTFAAAAHTLWGKL